VVKRLLALILALAICMIGNINALATDDKSMKIELNGEAIDMPAKVFDGELYLPLRAVSEKLGFEVLWSGKNREIKITKPEKHININLNDYKIVVNDHEYFVQGGYRFVDDRTYMRQDFFSDNMGLKVIWDKVGNDVRIYSVKENPVVINTKKEMTEEDMESIVSENTVDYDKDSKNEKVVVRMVDGDQYEETAAGPFEGWNWKGKFVVSLIDEAGKIVSELDLNKAFGDGDLLFNSRFQIKFDDYNNDGNPDFVLGQYASSNGNVYRLFTIKDDGIELLPLKTGEIFSSGGRSRYTTEFEKFGKNGFINFYYDNTKGKNIKQYFVWDGSQFELKSSVEEDAAFGKLK